MQIDEQDHPKLINIISVQTSSGTKTIEIYKGDLANFKLQTDLLAFSSFINDYYPLDGTLIGALERKFDINIGLLAINTPFDFRKSLNCWVSEEIQDTYFKRLLCLEGINNEIMMNGNADELFQNIFATLSLLNFKNIPSSSITLPMLGTGSQGVKFKHVVKSFMEIAVDALKKNTFLDTINFVEINESHACKINNTIDDILDRDKEKKKEIIDAKLFDLYNDILQKLLRIKTSNTAYQNNNSINNLISKILLKKVKFYEIGILARKVMELLLRDMTGKSSVTSLYEQILHLKTNKNVATWMTSYFHILKNLSNYAAHEVEPRVIPNAINEEDRIIFSHLFNRFLDFYLEFKMKE